MDPITILGSVITGIDVIKFAYQGISKIAGLPKAFEAVKEQLTFVQATFRVAKDNVEKGSKPLSELPYSQYEPISRLVGQCDTSIKELQRIFTNLEDRCKKDQDSNSWNRVRGWYVQVLGGMKSHRVESLMKDILRDMEKLGRYEVFQLSAKLDQIQRAIDVLSEIERLEPSIPDSEFDAQGANHATQHIASGGKGTINNTVGGSHNFVSGDYAMTGEHAQMHIEIQSEESQSWMQELRVTNPRDDKRRIEDKARGGLLRDSYAWILSNPRYVQWRQSNNESKVGPLWIRGGAGKGKTMLICGIINELEKEPGTAAVQPAYFFCQGTSENHNNATALLRGLLYMLVVQHPHVHSYVKDRYKATGRRLYEDADAWFALSDILTEILIVLDGKILIIDALDECITDRDRLLDLIVEISRTSNTRWIVSSRDWSDVREKLSTPSMATVLLDLDDELMSQAVNWYILHQVRRLEELKNYSKRIQDKVQQYLFNHAHNTFLWVALACRELEMTHRDNVDKTLQTFSAGLDSLYDKARDRIESSEYREPCKMILAVACTVYRPISPQKLASISDLPVRFTSRTGEFDTLVSVCRSFLTLQNNALVFEHHSAKDFLMNKANSWILSNGVSHQHRVVFTRSVGVMSRTLHRDIYGLDDPGVDTDHVVAPDPDPLAPVRYPCMHWVDHFQLAHPTDPTGDFIEDCDLVLGFLQQNGLYWLEAMSLLRVVPQAVAATEKLIRVISLIDKLPLYRRKLHQWLQGGQVMSLADLVRDSRRFVLFFKDIIARNPLQLYASALLFSPRRSIVRNLFLEREYPEWLALPPPATEEDWDECVQVLVLESIVRGIAFSPDGGTFGLASDSGAVQFWDASSSSLKQKTEGHQRSATAIAFSPDSRTAASASWDETIRLWEVESGRHIRTLSGHKAEVDNVVFSHDGKTIVSASRDRTVRVWIATSGTLRNIIQTSDCTVLSTHGTFADWLKFGLENPQIRDLASGNEVATLLGSQETPLGNVDISPDGTAVATTSVMGTLTIWDARTGRQMQELTCLSDLYGMQHIRFCLDGKTIVSISPDHILRLWALDSGRLTRTLMSPHDKPVLAVASSPGGTKLVSSSEDKSLRIWELNVDTPTEVPRRYQEKVDRIMFSSDGKTVLSISRALPVMEQTFPIGGGWDVLLWDAMTGMFKAQLESPPPKLRTNELVFSPDSSAILAWDCGSLLLWDATSGALRQRVRIIAYELRFALSPDSRRVAFSSEKIPTFKFWDIRLAKLRAISAYDIERKNRLLWARPLGFSPNGRTLAITAPPGMIFHLSCSDGSVVWESKGNGKEIEAAVFLDDETFAWSSEPARGAIHLSDGGELCGELRNSDGDFITELVLSPDQSTLAAMSAKGFAELWDIASRTSRWTYQGPGQVRSLSFTPDGEAVLPVLKFNVDDENITTAKFATATISTSSGDADIKLYCVTRGGWLMRNSQRLLWLPPGYRPGSITVYGSTVAFGCAGGRVVMLHFQ